MKKIGVWMDKEKAHLVHLDGDGERMETIMSNVEDYNAVGGARHKNKWGPQDQVHDSTYTEREKHQMKRYFRDLADTLKGADAIALFGPAETNVKFEKFLKENHKQLSEKIEGVEKADSMTDNQVKALVRDYFKN
ncbi:hypothetical protein [Robertkochia aurantiaca]|uniref:hypothetical protein n=1 Tax=Robertkochia aurantiaca TaxID=2873700 RepID=UPI001CCB5651|nr:hypothetical protein [Robertkochia sp. 3YJGBD-33]